MRRGPRARLPRHGTLRAMKAAGLASLAFAVCACSLFAVPVADLQKFENCRFVPTEWADGDSFTAEIAPGRQEVLRLYFADCPESTAAQENDQRRLREQSAYFGVEDPKVTLEFGHRASAETASVLSKPFTVHTVFARALGQSAKPRIYAFVTTSDGKDLSELLVSEGLARSYGVGRTSPSGLSVEEAKERMDDLELQAALEKKGVWSKTNPDKIADLREQRRKEDKALSEQFAVAGPLDLNAASVDEIEQLPGVGPVLAERIAARRPYASVDDLRAVPGISEKTFEKIRPKVKAGP